MSDLHAMFGGFITDHLQAELAMPQYLQQLLDLSALRLLDSEIIIEDNFTARKALGEPRVNQPLESFEQTFVIDQLCKAVKQDGFGQHFHQIIGLFGSIMLQLTASNEQQQNVNDWLEQGHFGHFLMTDGGGPTLANWKTTLDAQSDNWQLTIDKKWGIEAQQLGFVMVVARQPGKPFPLTLLLSPEQSQQLQSQSIGMPYLDGALQLGNVQGKIDVSRDQLLKKGGLGSVNRFLTLVRPRFVKSLMNHLIYLNAHQRLLIDDNITESIHFINAAADKCLSQTTFSMHSVDQVLALKFAANELMLDLVAKGCLPTLTDQRDLLGFSKMEGSSYRCFFEIYSKQKRARK
jgi:hypothetical protein